MTQKIALVLTPSEFEAVFSSVKGKTLKLRQLKKDGAPDVHWHRLEAYERAYSKMCKIDFRQEGEK